LSVLKKDIMYISVHKDAQRIIQLRQVLPLSKVSNALIATSLKSLEIRMCYGLKPHRM
jgi:hypothetical protein